VDFELPEDQATIRRAVAELAAKFDDQYLMGKDAAHEFPTEAARDISPTHQRRSKAP
jgi:acyl-CoA dehydrogenase